MVDRNAAISFVAQYPNWARRITRSKDVDLVNLKLFLLDSTNYLPNRATYAQRMWHIINDVIDKPLCIICNNTVHSWSEGRKQYSTYCSRKCSTQDNALVQRRLATIASIRYKPKRDAAKTKRKATNLRRYGVEFPLQSPAIVDKVKKTNLTRYGYEHISQVPAITQKRTDALVRNYKDNDCKNKIIEKIKQTNLTRHGIEWGILTAQSRATNQEVLLERYGVKHPLLCPAIYEKTRESQFKNFDGRWHQQSHMSEAALNNLSSREWLIEHHHTQKIPLTIIASELNVSDVTVGNRCHQLDVEIKHFMVSAQEREISDFVKLHINDTITNTRNIIGTELDIYIPDKQIAIEYCGLYWHSDAFVRKTAHFDKLTKCNALNIQLLTIFEHEWVKSKDIVKMGILRKLGVSTERKIAARKTTCSKISITKKKEFLEKTHIQGNGLSTINYGLWYANELVAVVGIKRGADETYELNRYATNCIVQGGLSKLLKQFERDYQPKRLYTFADRRWGSGELYIKTGFILDSIIPIDYGYTNGDGTLHHKFNFRRKRLANMLPNFRPELSETENMAAHNWHKVYDCGKYKFVKKY